MEKTGECQNSYWVDFYKKTSPEKVPSSFCTFICEKYDLKEKKVLELCSGNGRDTYYLAKHSEKITAVDYAVQPKDIDNTTFIKSEICSFLNRVDPGDYDATYCRFGLHSMDEASEDVVLDFSRLIFFEFRSDKDDSFINDHYRRTINGNIFLKKIINKDYSVVYFNESKGLALYGKEDPMIIRVVAQRRGMV